MISYDNQLLDGVNSLTDAIDQLKTQLVGGDYTNLKDKIQGVTDRFDMLEDAFDKRQEVIMGVTA
jgi:hypothetical protein